MKDKMNYEVVNKKIKIDEKRNVTIKLTMPKFQK